MRRLLVLSTTLLLFAASSATATSVRTHAPTGKIFHGNGGQTLAPFTVSRPSTLFRRNTGSILQIFPSGGGVDGSVNAQASKGWTYLPSGRYRLQINAIGAWTISIAAGSVPPSRLSNGKLGYSGNGGLTLPPFSTRHGGSLSWRSAGSIFQIFPSDYGSGGAVNSQAHAGSTYLNSGMHRLQINAIGAWSIAWRP